MRLIVKRLSLVIILLLLAPSPVLAGLIGTIQPPLTGTLTNVSGATSLLAAIIRLITIGAGLYALINFAIAGIGFINSGGNPEAVHHSWSRIYQTLIGICVVVLSFALAGLLGMILFGDASAILSPAFSGP